MSNKQAIEQQLNHIIENTDRLETIYSTSAQFFSMVSLSYELIDLIGKLNEEEKNLFFPLLCLLTIRIKIVWHVFRLQSNWKGYMKQRYTFENILSRQNQSIHSRSPF